jgi:hypothetical protein
VVVEVGCTARVPDGATVPISLISSCAAPVESHVRSAEPPQSMMFLSTSNFVIKCRAA